MKLPKENFIDLIYPIGSLYWSKNSTDPAELFGGTWERVKDTFILAAGDTYSAGSTGGEATHTLTTNEMPSHSHSLPNNGALDNETDGGIRVSGQGIYISGVILNTNTTGGGQAHNNMPPYKVYYCWERTS